MRDPKSGSSGPRGQGQWCEADGQPSATSSCSLGACLPPRYLVPLLLQLRQLALQGGHPLLVDLAVHPALLELQQGLLLLLPVLHGAGAGGTDTAGRMGGMGRLGGSSREKQGEFTLVPCASVPRSPAEWLCPASTPESGHHSSRGCGTCSGSAHSVPRAHTQLPSTCLALPLACWLLSRRHPPSPFAAAQRVPGTTLGPPMTCSALTAHWPPVSSLPRPPAGTSVFRLCAGVHAALAKEHVDKQTT